MGLGTTVSLADQGSTVMTVVPNRVELNTEVGLVLTLFTKLSIDS